LLHYFYNTQEWIFLYLKSETNGSMPYSPHENLCGFCGEVCGSNNEISRKTGQTIFSCTHYKTYSNGAASKSSGRTPCTNRLLSCPTCMDLILTCNISTHFNNRHPDSDWSIFESFTPSRKEILAVHNFNYS
jgi:hypothetical protein